jgi:putative transposase
MAVTSDERFYMTTDNQQATARRLGVYQKLVSNRKTRGSARAADPGSKRTQKRRARIAKLHGKVARQREHQQQYVAKRIVDTGNVIGVSDENYAKLKKARREEPYEHRERKIKRLTNRSMTGTSPGKVRELILEKAEVAGRQVIQIEAAYATQTCHACGYVNDPPISLSVVYWACPRCGTRHDRDVNNAVNLAAQVRERQRE